MGVRINSKRMLLFRRGIEKETRRKKSKHTKYKWRTGGDDGSKRRKSETKPDVHHAGGFRRTQLRGKTQLALGYRECCNSYGDRKKWTSKGGHYSHAMLL